MSEIFTSTAERVKIHTNRKVNKKIRDKTINNISRYTEKSKREIEDRIKELDKEWDIERVLEANAATAVMISTILGFTVSKKWFILSGVVEGFLFQHAVQGWCPPLGIFRGLGVRTYLEINEEREILKKLSK